MQQASPEPDVVSDEEAIRVMTLEAFADTIVPGNKRFANDRAIAGVSEDGGSVAAGALELLETPAGGLSQWLGGLASMLNGHAGNFASKQQIELDPSVPAFVSLSYQQRAELVLELTAWEHPERQGWVNLVMFSNMAYDAAAHLHTVDALAAGHPGLLTLGFSRRTRTVCGAFPNYSYGRPLARIHPDTTPKREPQMTHTESTDVLIIGSGFGGSIAAYHLAAGGARVVVLERGPWLDADDFDQDFNLGSSSTRIFEFTVGDGMSVLGGNCVGGGSVVYFATMPRAPWYTFERHGSIGRRMWPSTIAGARWTRGMTGSRSHCRSARSGWERVPYAGGLWAAACDNAGHTCNPVPAAVDVAKCTNCNWMMAGCKFDAKRSLLLNYLPGALAHGAEIRPLHEVQKITKEAPDGGFRIHYNTLDDVDYRVQTGNGTIDAKIVIVAAGTAATPVILQRSEADLGAMPHAVGRYFSGNGERLNTALINEDRVRDVLGLDRATGSPSRPPRSARGRSRPAGTGWTDRCRNTTASRWSSCTSRRAWAPSWPRCLTRSARAGSARKRRRLCAVEVLADHLHDVRGRQRGRVRATAGDRQLDAGLPADVRSRSAALRADGQHLERWDKSDAAVRSILEKDGLSRVMPWTNEVVGAYTVHPLASCRIGDDPQTSALDDNHELRGHPGIFVTDGSAVPGALNVNPAMTIAALAERAMPAIVRMPGPVASMSATAHQPRKVPPAPAGTSTAPPSECWPTDDQHPDPEAAQSPGREQADAIRSAQVTGPDQACNAGRSRSRSARCTHWCISRPSGTSG